MTAVMKFFGLKPTGFRAEWQELSEQDKNDLKNGVADGSLTYP
jgi:hypothetical protein